MKVCESVEYGWGDAGVRGGAGGGDRLSKLCLFFYPLWINLRCDLLRGWLLIV